MRAASDEAFGAWGAFVSSLRNGELVATATHAGTGERRDLDPVEWPYAGFVDVRDGDLYELRQGHRALRWSAIKLRAANASRQKRNRTNEGTLARL